MPTIYKRLEFYCLQNKMPRLSKEQRRELGTFFFNRIWKRSKYWLEAGKVRVQKVLSMEPEGEVMAISYPRFAIQKIYKAIAKYYEINDIKPITKPKPKAQTPPVTPTVEKRARKRIPLKQPSNV